MPDSPVGQELRATFRQQGNRVPGVASPIICRSALAIEAHRGVASLSHTLGMGKRCALRRAPMAGGSLRHLIRDATLGLTAAPAVASAYARERVDADVGPSALAVATIACAAGQMAGPVLTGVVIDVFGIESMAVLVLVGYALATVFAKLDQLHQMRMHQSS